MSIGTGRDPQANTLLQSTPSSVHLAMPSICLMEALSALEQEQKYRRRFGNELELQIGQLQRDVTSSHAQSLLSYLVQSRQENRALIADVEARLFQALDQISSKAETIALTADILRESRITSFSDIDHTDNLILHCILHHARLHPDEVKVFLSSNNRDFGKMEVQAALRNAGVTNYFVRTQDFLGWLQSR
jgi:hypothetical protein